MKISNVVQQSPEWWELKVGSIGGTRFSQVISTRKNRLIASLVNETLNGYCAQDDYISDDMQFGIDNEPVARELYSKQSGINFIEVGAILSDYSDIHHASPDGIDDEGRGIVLEIKSTENGDIHIDRFINGVESAHIGQLKNYFAVSDDVKEVHFVSFCPFRPERPLVPIILKAEDFLKETHSARKKVKLIEFEVKKIINEFTF